MLNKRNGRPAYPVHEKKEMFDTKRVPECTAPRTTRTAHTKHFSNLPMHHNCFSGRNVVA